MHLHLGYLNQRRARQHSTEIMGKQYKKMLITFASLSLLLAGIAHTAFAAEENPFAKNYKQQNTNQLKSMQANPDTKIMQSNHKEDDNITMLEDGYDMIGSSGFTAVEASPDLALQHGRSIKADVVLIYKKYDSAKVSGSKLQLIKEAAKKGGEIDPNDLVEEPTQYNFYASYWAKLPMPRFGVHVIKLKINTNTSPVEEKKIEALPGLKAIAVIKESPAAQAGIMRGDTLLKMGEVELSSVEDLFAAVKRYSGKTVDVTLERKGEPLSLAVAINPAK